MLEWYFIGNSIFNAKMSGFSQCKQTLCNIIRIIYRIIFGWKWIMSWFQLEQLWSGLSQGSVLSPILFKVYIASLFSLNIQVVLTFADDVIMYTAGIGKFGHQIV